MPDRPPGTDGRASLRCLSQSSSPHKCRFHLGFSLGTFLHTWESTTGDNRCQGLVCQGVPCGTLVLLLRTTRATVAPAWAGAKSPYQNELTSQWRTPIFSQTIRCIVGVQHLHRVFAYLLQTLNIFLLGVLKRPTNMVASAETIRQVESIFREHLNWNFQGKLKFDPIRVEPTLDQQGVGLRQAERHHGGDVRPAESPGHIQNPHRVLRREEGRLHEGRTPAPRTMGKEIQ